MRSEPMTGKVFGLLKIVGDSGERNKSKDIMWLCQCECGGTTKARRYDLNRGDFMSCGCNRGSNISAAKIVHGKSRTAEYKIWDGMIQRCTNPNSDSYADYGGRGIIVCERWRQSFENFIEDMGNRPSDDLSIERIDNSNGYTKGNCKWATKSEQAFNRRKQSGCTSDTINVHFDAKSGKWIARRYDGLVRTYVGSFDTEEAAAMSLREGQ